MKNKNETVSLAFNDIARGGTSDKVYHLALEQNGTGFTVTAQYGRRGGALAVDIKTKRSSSLPYDYEDAKAVFDRVLREKKAKGYVETGAKAPAAQVQPPATVSAGFELKLQELLEEITNETTLAHLLASEDYWMQDKSDGHSRGAVKDGSGSIYGLNKLGKRVPLPAEIVAELARIKLDSFQIDAELVGDKLVCRDLLHADGDESGQPYELRFTRLVHLICAANLNLVTLVETWAGRNNKAAAYARSQAERREGVVFKMRSARHRGGRNGQHKKFKFVKTLSAIAGEPRAEGKDSVTIHLFDEIGILRRVGTVSLIGKDKIHAGDVLEVRYLYAFPSRMLCQARLMRIRADVTAEECTMAQLIFKREEQS